MKSPKAPKKTAEQVNVERRQQFMLDEEIEETENRLKSVARGKLGKSSLLASGANRRGGASGSAGGGSSFLSSGSAPTSGPSGGGGTTPSIGSSVNHK